MPRRQDSHPSGLTDSSKLHPAMWWARKIEKRYGRTKRTDPKIPPVGGLPGVNVQHHRRLHDANRKTSGVKVVLYSIGDIENDVSLPFPVPLSLSGTIVSVRVDGPSLNGDTFTLKVNGTTVTTVTSNNTSFCQKAITENDEIEVTVTTVSTGSGAALCQVEVAQ